MTDDDRLTDEEIRRLTDDPRIADYFEAVIAEWNRLIRKRLDGTQSD